MVLWTAEIYQIVEKTKMKKMATLDREENKRILTTKVEYTTNFYAIIIYFIIKRKLYQIIQYFSH